MSKEQIEEMIEHVRGVTDDCQNCNLYKDKLCDYNCDLCEAIQLACEALYTAGYRKQSEIADDIIAIIQQRMARNIERLNGCQSNIWKVGYLAKNEAYQDIKEIVEQRMKGSRNG